jgi:hypothetical protein
MKDLEKEKRELQREWLWRNGSGKYIGRQEMAKRLNESAARRGLVKSSLCSCIGDDEDDYLDSFLSKSKPTRSFDASRTSSGQYSLNDREPEHDSSSSFRSLGEDFSSLTSQESKNCQDFSSVRESEAQKPQKDERPELVRLNDSSTSLSLGDDYFSP